MSARHNRTLISVGRTAHERLQQARVVVVGMNPLGAEVAKVLLLFGVNKVVMCDDGMVGEEDVGANMFVTEGDVGKKRVDVLMESMKRLNPTAEIECVGEEELIGAVGTANIVVFAKEGGFEEICKVDEACRAAGVGFVVGDCWSFCGFVFIDFGDKFVVENVNGRPPEKYRIDAISNANPGIIRFAGREQPSFPRECLIQFQGLESMTELNDLGPIRMHYEDGIASLDCDTTGFSKFDRVNRNGFAVRVKVPQEVSFKPYRECLDAGFNSTWFGDKHSFVREFFVNRQKDKQRSCCYEPATASLIAGIMANEAIKYVTHQLVPMSQQWYLYMRDELLQLPNQFLAPDISKMNVAVVGVGATGCEVAKLLALSGISRLALIDPDNIETTNLNRQVLFATEDVGLNKAEAAKRTLHLVRPNLEIDVFPHFISKETENLFTDEWFAKFDAVFAMVDSFAARQYIDSRCAIGRIPMYSGGIDKTTADWQAVVPDYTPRYGYGSAPGQNDDTTPSCTLKLFPYKPEHCIEWAHHQLNRVMQKTIHITTFEQCVQQACAFVANKFILRIKDLQYFHPKDERVQGTLYWTSHRIYPTELAPDMSNPHVRQLITSFAKILAGQHGIAERELDFDHVNLDTNWTPPDERNRSTFVDDPTSSLAITQNHFDHDNELQIDFIEAASNLRSLNYGLGTIDRLYAQSLAGKIDAAVSTTASICSAGSFTEFLASLVNPDRLHTGKFVASPFSLMTYLESQTPKMRLGNTDETFTSWDYWRFKGTETLASVQRHIEERAKCPIGIWSTVDGFMLPLDGQRSFCGGAITTSSTFDDVFKDREIPRVLLEICFEDEKLLIPQVIIDITPRIAH